MTLRQLAAILILSGVGAALQPAGADEPLQLAGGEVGRDGILTHRLAEVIGDAGPTTTPILQINGPRVSGRVYEIAGRVEYSEVEGDGYLEMRTVFPDGSESFTRTLESDGPLAKLTGSSGPRDFELPIRLTDDAPAPIQLEVRVVLPGTGRVQLSDFRLGGSAEGSLPGGVWWSARAGGAIGAAMGCAVGLIASAIGVLCALGRARPLVQGLLVAGLVLGSSCIAAGAVALALAQPREVWLPLLLVGAIGAVLPLTLRGTVRRRFALAQSPHLAA